MVPPARVHTLTSMGTVIFLVAAVVSGLWLLANAARKEERRFVGTGLSALEETITPHAAEFRHIDEHAADVAEDDDGAGGDGPHRLA